MRLYLEVARRGFRRHATYRGAAIGGLFTNTVFGFMRGYVLLALLEARPGIGGYDATDALTYVWLTQGLIMVTYTWGWVVVSEKIRTGEIATDLCRPVNLQSWLLAEDLGRAGYHLLARGITPFLIGSVFFDLRLPSSLAQWAAFALSLFLAVVISFACRFAVNAAAFWWLDANGLMLVYGLGANFLGGFAIPTAMFPALLRPVVELLPFASVIQRPIDVFLGRYSGPALVGWLALQAFWAVALLALGRFVLRAGTRHLVVQGG